MAKVSITVGDIDLYSFTICKGEAIDVRADEITQKNSFAPWVRIYSPLGILVGSSFGATFGEVAITATNNGTFLVVIGNNEYYNNAGSGTYRLTVNGLIDEFHICATSISGTNLTLDGVGGTSNATYVALTSTNIATPANLWTPIRTNQFDQFGVFSFTNLFNVNEPQRFFRLLLP